MCDDQATDFLGGLCSSKDFEYTEREWTIENELKLLNAISNFGFDNWKHIAVLVPPYTPEQCENHYYQKFSKDFDGLRGAPLCSNNCKMKLDIKDADTFSSFHIWTMNQTLASMKWQNEMKDKIPIGFGEFPHLKNTNVPYHDTGYNNIRSDFMVEYNDNAENILEIISSNQQEDETPDDDSDLIAEIEFTLLQSYNSCLRDRNYRKRIVRNHGLVDRRKTYSMLQRLAVPFGYQDLKALLPIMRFLDGPQFDFLIERLKYQNDLRLKRNSLIDCRKNGLKYINTIDIYEKLKNKRQHYNSELMYENSLFQDERTTQRKPSQPLALQHLPGYSLLCEDEKNLCSNSRIVPETYNIFKELLITHCKKNNGLKLAQARSLIKIDVNKTRKIYDYLKSVKLIWLPEEA